MARRVLDVRFPVGGLNRRYGYQTQPPYTTPDCLNVRPFDSIEGRERGGSRPGLGKAFALQLGSGNPVRLLTAMSSLNEAGSSVFVETFSSGTALSTALWDPYVSSDGEIPYAGDVKVLNGWGTTQNQFSDQRVGAIYKVTTISQTAPIQIDAYVSGLQLSTDFHTVEFFIGLHNTVPVASNAIRITLRGYSLSPLMSFRIQAGTEVHASTFSSGVGAANVRVKVTAQGIIELYYDDLSTPKATLDSLNFTRPGSRVGFGLQSLGFGAPLATDVMIDNFRVAYESAAGGLPPVALAASADGFLYRESNSGSLAIVDANSRPIRDDDHVNAVDRLGILYIADTEGIVAEGINGVVSAGTDFGSVTYSDWTTLLSTVATDNNFYAHYNIQITSGGVGPATIGNYPISGVSAGSITLASAPGNATGVTFRLLRVPKVYVSSTNVITNWVATSGILPLACPIIALWRDRIVLAGDPDIPHVWFMSRRANPYDWNFGASVVDVQRAVAGTSSFMGTDTTTEAGGIGIPITAIMPHSDDVLLMGTAYYIARFSGDPAYGGRVDIISGDGVGVVAPTAWCRGPNGETIFLSRDGIYMIGAGGSTYPQSISRELIPREIIDKINPSLYLIQLAYDVGARGVHIMLTPKTAGVTTHYFLDWQTKGFWPFQYGPTMDPTALTYYPASDPTNEAVLLGCRDGYVRKHGDGFHTDDGTDFPSHALFGGHRLGGSDVAFGSMEDLDCALDAQSGGVDWAVHVGNDAESAFHSLAAATGSFLNGANRTARPRRRGHTGYIKLSSEGGTRWSLERLSLMVESLGPMRNV